MHKTFDQASSDGEVLEAAVEEAESRPANFEVRVNGLLQIKNEDLTTFQGAISDLQAIVDGSGDPTIMEQRYAGWKHEDYVALLKRLDDTSETAE